MPETTTTTVTQNSYGQYQVTVPKSLADAFELKGKRVEWGVASGNKLEVTIVDE